MRIQPEETAVPIVEQHSGRNARILEYIQANDANMHKNQSNQYNRSDSMYHLKKPG